MVLLDLLLQTHMAKISFAKVNVGVRGFGTTLGLHIMFISRTYRSSVKMNDTKNSNEKKSNVNNKNKKCTSWLALLFIVFQS